MIDKILIYTNVFITRCKHGAFICKIQPIYRISLCTIKNNLANRYMTVKERLINFIKYKGLSQCKRIRFGEIIYIVSKY